MTNIVELPSESPPDKAIAGRVGGGGMVSLRGQIEPDEPEAGSRPLAARLLARLAAGLRALLARATRLPGWARWSCVAGTVLLLLMGLLAALLAPTPTRGTHARSLRPAAAVTAPAGDAGPTATDPAFRLQDLSANDAQVYNSLIPLSTEPNPPAKPFVLKANTLQDEIRATDCLTAAVHYEAASEPLEGQQAVAQVVLNRLRDPHYPKSVCDVVFQGLGLATGWQFSFTGDGSLARKPAPESWARARKVAVAALHGFVAKQVGQATHYHTVWVAPYWSPTLLKVANIGAHIFYRWTGSMGLARAFNGQYAGSEPYLPQIAALDPAVTDVVAPPEPPATVEAPAAATTDPEPTAEQQAALQSFQAAQTAAAEAPPPPPPAPVAAPPPSTPPSPRKPNWSRLPTGSGW